MQNLKRKFLQLRKKTAEANEEKGISMLNIILYILGVISVIAAAIYFFMRREPAQSAADIAREQASSEPTSKPEQEETHLEPETQPETEQSAQEGTQTESTETEKTLHLIIPTISRLIMTMKITTDKNSKYNKFLPFIFMEPFKFSPSGLTYINCRRCFYLSYNHGINYAGGFPGVFSTLDISHKNQISRSFNQRNVF